MTPRQRPSRSDGSGVRQDGAARGGRLRSGAPGPGRPGETDAGETDTGPAPSGAAAQLRVGVVGCGNISGQYLEACRRFAVLSVEAVADLDGELASQRAAQYGVPRTLEPAALLTDPAIDLVVNLTAPSAHAEITRAALDAGKAVYSEKPLATTRADGRALLEAARRSGARLGCAPDTFLGGALQTARKLVDDGWIGRPLAASAAMLNHGMEHWHPNPDAFFQPGAGPLFDVGVYYLTALVSLLGPVAKVAGAAATGFPHRRIGAGPRTGERVTVRTPTHVTTLLEFADGVLATLVASFEVWASELPRLEIYGSEGTLQLPDPNFFGGRLRLRRAGAEQWSDVPLSHGYSETARGLGAADLAQAQLVGRPHRASGQLAYHVLDVMQASLESAQGGQRIAVESRVERPAPFPLGLADGDLDS